MRNHPDVISLYMIGLSQNQVARTLGISQTTVSHVLRANNISREDQKRSSKKSSSSA